MVPPIRWCGWCQHPAMATIMAQLMLINIDVAMCQEEYSSQGGWPKHCGFHHGMWVYMDGGFLEPKISKQKDLT